MTGTLWTDLTIFFANCMARICQPLASISKWSAFLVLDHIISCSKVTSSSSKADQWRLHISVLFVRLFIGWEVDGKLPDIHAPRSRAGTINAAKYVKTEKVLGQRRLEVLLSETDDPSEEQLQHAKSSTMDRSILRHYSTMLEFSAAIRILSSRLISPAEVERGCAALSRACQSWANMGVHLTPYFHFAQHLQQQFLWFGPCYTTWAFPYERNNGFLGQTNHNNHKGGELECTMMCKWWRWVLVHDLVSWCYHPCHLTLPDPWHR
jgi:hypothetical protein